MAEYPDLTRAREAVEALMIDAVTVTHQADGTLNESTGQIDLPAPTTRYSGIAKVRRYRTQPTDSVEGGAETYVTRVAVGLPVTTSTDIAPGDYVEVTASERDPSLPGRKYIVMEVPGNTFAIQRILECEEARIVDQVRP